jgi:predicted nucleotidyltransferase
MSIHQKIVKEILEEYKDKPGVIGVRVVGSVSRGEERPDSDVDIEVVKEKGNSWSYTEHKRHGIDIDFVVSSKTHLINQVENYPYLCYIDLDKKILYDSTGLLKELQKKIKKYMKTHSQVKKFWDTEFKKMRLAKSKGIKQKSLIKMFDEAEVLFSKNHKIKRNYFR